MSSIPPPAEGPGSLDVGWGLRGLPCLERQTQSSRASGGHSQPSARRVGALAQATFTEAAPLPVGAVIRWPAHDVVAPRATQTCRGCTCPAGARDLSAQCPRPQPAPWCCGPQTLALAEQSRAPSSSFPLRAQRSGEVPFRDPAPSTVQFTGQATLGLGQLAAQKSLLGVQIGVYPGLAARTWGPDSGNLS